MAAMRPPIAPDQITLGLLAGGRASRLGGVDKAWLERAGVAQVERWRRRFDGETARIIVSANRDLPRYADHGLRAVPDRVPGDFGPVAGLIGAQSLAGALAGGAAATANVLTADVGGTTFDVGVIREGVPLRRPTSWHGQYEYYVPTLDVRSVGSGGGSLVAYDAERHTLQVGPDSAGARPGPVCYGRGGTQATVSDANLIMGYLNPEFFLEGEIGLDVDGARAALARAGEPLGLESAHDGGTDEPEMAGDEHPRCTIHSSLLLTTDAPVSPLRRGESRHAGTAPPAVCSTPVTQRPTLPPCSLRRTKRTPSTSPHPSVRTDWG